jgi:HlyD family secretion protein
MKKVRRLFRIPAIGIVVLILLFLLYVLSRRIEDRFNVDRSLFSIAIVQRGDRSRDVRGPGNLAAMGKSSNLMATLQIVASMAGDIALNQKVSIDTQNGVLPGHVIRIADKIKNGTRGIDVALDAPSPTGVSRGTPVIGTIELETLRDIVYVDRPALTEPNTVHSIFKMSADGAELIWVPVRLGRASTKEIEVLDGLKAGDSVVISDMTNYENVDQIQVSRIGK